MVRSILIGCVLLTAAGAASGQMGGQMQYEQFIEKVQSGQIEKVALGPGNMIAATVIVDGQEQVFLTAHPSNPQNDPLLTRFLAEHQVKVPAELVEQPRWVAGMTVCALYLIPVFIIVFLVLIYRKVKRIEQGLRGAGTGGIM